MTNAKIKVGDTIYVSRFGRRPIEIDCPVCFRKGVVVLTLGNGDSVEMPCEYCRNGLGTPVTGRVTEYRFDAGVEKATVSEIRIAQTASGDTFEYMAGSYIYYTKDVFSTHEDALAESNRRADKHNLEQETKAKFIKGKPDKNYSWNAGYHLRNAKEAMEQYEYHTKMAKICKTKARMESQ